MPTRRATKIVATLGPASSDPALLEAMIRAGVNVVRLNFSHGKAQDHIDRAATVRAAAQRAGREVAIMADLQGPKIRVGKFAEGKVQLESGAKFVLDASRTELGDIEGVGLDYKELPRDVKAGDLLLLNDGLIVLTVDAVRGEEVHTTVKVGGELSNNKGINKKGGGLTAPALTAKDMEDIRTAMSFQADYVAVSFPKNATDMEMARQLCNVAASEYRHKPGLIAKIERAEAIPHLEAILRVSDGIMVARGDLAVEVGNAAVPALQKKMIRMARELDKVVITATQMMESMITNPVPTRAEVSDVANAVLDGTDAVMLSAETAAGRYPLETVEEMATICAAAEAAEDHPSRRGLHRPDLWAHRPVHCHGCAVHGPPPGRQGHCGHDRQRRHGAVDEPARHPHSHLRAHAQGGHAAQDGHVPQRAPAAHGHQRRPRHRAGAGRGPSQEPQHRAKGRCLCHHLWRAHGCTWRDQHAENLRGQLKRLLGLVIQKR